MADGATESLFPAWRLFVEEELNELANVVELNAEEPWEAEVHKFIVEAWGMLRDQRTASRDEVGAAPVLRPEGAS